LTVLAEDHRRLSRCFTRRRVRGVDLERIVAARESSTLPRSTGRRPALQLRRVEGSARARRPAVLALEVLYLPSTALPAASAGSRPFLGEELVPARATEHLITFQPAPRNTPSSSWTILPLPAHRPVETLQVAVDDEDRLSSFSRPTERDRAQRLGFVALASPRTPTPCGCLSWRPASFEYLQEARW